ncbi:DUF418 domain-containing protein [uncultured Alistipes sp.]|jgi:hypothetical protein bfra3_10936|uniref:DUF418 domain-containing protein n=1 Tax=uncultured Alistipes sp. TaxID=538949 RepID=UPI0025FD6CBB|nr:DUF418 domain-containing protein [uncultured Alistipes sp.]
MNEVSKTPRVEVVDALRGFAVMAILLVHSLEHFIFPVYPDAASQPAWLNTLDAGVFSVIFTLFAGKAYAIFALLFGFTFHIQYANQESKGNDFGWRFFWRLVLLVLFATVNAAFFPAGDVLLLFSIVGLVLVLVRKWSDKAVLILAVILLLQPVEWGHYIASLVNPDYTLPDLGVGAMYAQVATYTKAGNWGEFLLGNITLGQKASLMWAVGAGRFCQTAGLFLLGLLLGRKQLFISSESSARFWINALIISAVAFAPLYQLNIELAGDGITAKTVGVVMDMWQKFAFTIVLVSSFVLLYRKKSFKKLTANLRFYGRMSLTNYIGQSVLGALVYFPIGLYLAPYCGYTLSLIVGIVILIGQVIFSKWWLKTHKQGPFESLWHKLTWLGKSR